MEQTTTAAGTAYVAKTMFGLEEVLANELRNLGADNVEVLYRAVGFTANTELLYKANLHLRTALRILQPIFTFKARNEEELYRGVQKINWSQYMDNDGTLAIDSATSGEIFTHSQYASLKAKDAIVDQFRDRTGTRPDVELRDPDLRVNLHIHGEDCTVSLDTSGESLHRRGYRLDTNPAPINEVLAAGMVLLTGWDGNSHFYDPMCGSGTILIEAAMYALNMPPGMHRKKFAFMNWRNYDAKLWQKIYDEGLAGINDEFEYKLLGTDILGKTVQIARENIESAKLDEDVRISVKPFEEAIAPGTEGLLIMNPPYGERMLKNDINAFYKMIGDQLKKNFSGWDAWVLSSNMEALKQVGLRPSRRIQLFNGSLDCRFCYYPMYRGSKKAKFQQSEE